MREETVGSHIDCIRAACHEHSKLEIAGSACVSKVSKPKFHDS